MFTEATKEDKKCKEDIMERKKKKAERKRKRRRKKEKEKENAFVCLFACLLASITQN